MRRTSEPSRPILEAISRRAAIALAVLFIGLSLFGIWGTWFVKRTVADVVLKTFGLIESGVGVGRAKDLIVTSRTEVRQASETITTVGAQMQTNSPVLNALNERLETNLAPRFLQMQQVLAPVRDAVGTIGNVVSGINSLPMMTDRAPRLAALDEALKGLEELSANTSQLRGTLRTLAGAQKSDVADETIAKLKGLTQRIDSQLGKVQANVQEVQADVLALQVRLDQRKSQLLFVFNLLALLSTLALIWILYTNVVVFQHHWSRIRRLS